MQILVVNATQGGAKIKGTVQLSLKDAIKKYCKKPIDKSVVTPLLTFADDADELIKNVIPLLKNDIDNLNMIISNSRKGIAVSHGIKTLMVRNKFTKLLPKKKRILFDKINKESTIEANGDPLLQTTIFFKKVIAKLTKCRLKTIMIMAEKNFIFSEAAHTGSIKNPLVNVAIYGASRRIQTRDLKVDASINHFLTDQKDAITRSDRNIIILSAALTTSKSLKKSYKKTLNLLKKYNKTKDNSLLESSEPESIDLSDAEEYFKAGNWAHPLLDAKKAMLTESSKAYDKAEKIYNKALEMKEEAIKKAKEAENEDHDKMSDLLKYNALLKEARSIGRDDKDYSKSIKLMRKAVKLIPDDPQALWGIATALHHAGKIEESITEYRKLIKKFPENNTFKFEYAQVLLLNNQLQEGLREIGEVMEKTDEFDNFLARLGEIYFEANMFDEALTACNSYLKKFPFDYKIWHKKGDCFDKLGKTAQAKKAHAKALKIKPDFIKG